MKGQERVRQSKLSRQIAPLMRFLPEQNAHILRFTIHTEELLLALLEENQERVERLKEQFWMIFRDYQRKSQLSRLKGHSSLSSVVPHSGLRPIPLKFCDCRRKLHH